MHSFKSYLLIFAIYLYSSSLLHAQTTATKCGAAITPPAATTVCSGTQLTATPSGNFFYQWQKDGVNIPNANTRTLPLEESGSYRVIVRGASCAADTSAAVAMTVNKEEALFSIDKRERVNPQSADTCGIPVKVTLKNESKPATGLTYTWEILEGEDPADPKFVKYVEGTSATSENPILQFYKKGQYKIKLRIKGACFDPANPDGPVDPVDPDDPDAESDGRYVHEETVVIVYPQVQPQGFEECEDPTPGATITLSGSQLATLDLNLGTLRPGSITWTVPAGVTIDNPNIENPQITFPKRGTHVLSVKFANECEFSDALPGSQVTRIEVTFSPRPPKPVLSRSEAFVCAGGTYELAPTLNDPRRLYNFYANEFSTTPLNTGGPAPSYFAGPINGRMVIYVAAIEGQCESFERTPFTLNVIQQDIENSITADQTICANTKPVALNGSNAQVGTTRPIYLWESKATGEANFSPAAGTNNQQSYSPEALTETTAFRRTVTFEGCDVPNLSNEVIINVLPVIDPSTNVIQTNKTVVCKGDVPTLTGNLISGDIDYLWESSTTSATTGFIPAVGSDNTNGAQFTPGFITQTTWYRRTAKYKNTQCEPVPSAEAIQVTIDELPAGPAVKATTASTCQGGSAVLEVIPGTSTTPLTYVWYTESSGGTPIGSGTPFTTPPLTQNTTFYVEAVNANKCVSQQRTSVMVTVLPITADAGRDTTIIEGQSITLRGSGAAGATYTWSPATGLSNPNVANPVATPTVTTTYTLTVSNGDQDCVATDEVTITVIPRIRIVNTFSPNRDGINEFWEIENIQNFPEATVEIFNRYGAQVFKSNGYSQPWDGTHNGNPLPLATYYYIIRLNKNEKPFTGSVTIIK
ncbi:gliding motility-associated C-terminal domain-containing protein [Rufibacter tibetensis]|uniref:Ig-like domain-containing protein n=1 Tax=Rufibacter tibetensis TaxID=512763 RepID=A0A0P0CZW3_9BACT|nr:gliding motility-associated C-terminal domain-containing protein [Rufibacter tibetensis]ALJ01036.1 hypothetical protein DC20_21115 [Rufibacter tibetensis]